MANNVFTGGFDSITNYYKKDKSTGGFGSIIRRSNSLEVLTVLQEEQFTGDFDSITRRSNPVEALTVLQEGAIHWRL